jgi:hypothetical protein
VLFSSSQERNVAHYNTCYANYSKYPVYICKQCPQYAIENGESSVTCVKWIPGSETQFVGMYVCWYACVECLGKYLTAAPVLKQAVLKILITFV